MQSYYLPRQPYYIVPQGSTFVYNSQAPQYIPPASAPASSVPRSGYIPQAVPSAQLPPTSYYTPPPARAAPTQFTKVSTPHYAGGASHVRSASNPSQIQQSRSRNHSRSQSHHYSSGSPASSSSSTPVPAAPYRPVTAATTTTTAARASSKDRDRKETLVRYEAWKVSDNLWLRTQKQKAQERAEGRRPALAIVHAWNDYAARWGALKLYPPKDWLTWWTFPWPVEYQPQNTSDITVERVRALLLSNQHSYEKNKVERLVEEMERWNPTSFERTWAVTVQDRDGHRDMVRSGARRVFECLSALLTEESAKAGVPIQGQGYTINYVRR